jgi:hypothetical protein
VASNLSIIVRTVRWEYLIESQLQRTF